MLGHQPSQNILALVELQFKHGEKEIPISTNGGQINMLAR
jgi:U3 small nucleolar ribonucleoprotein component